MVFPRVLVDNTHEWMSVGTAFEICHFMAMEKRPRCPSIGYNEERIT